MIVEQVGGEEIQLRGILQPSRSPYEPVPKDSIAFESADLILYNGYNLRGLIKLMNAAGIKARKWGSGEALAVG